VLPSRNAMAESERGRNMQRSVRNRVGEIKELPTGMKGLLAAGLLAAVMSLVESALNCTATVTAEDAVNPKVIFYGDGTRSPCHGKASVGLLAYRCA
jgi:Na+(H+)/acetate symporter ActP